MLSDEGPETLISAGRFRRYEVSAGGILVEQQLFGLRIKAECDSEEIA